MSRAPKFTDTAKFAYPYADVEATKKPGYLARRFARIRAEQAATEAEAKAKVAPLKRAVK